MSKPNYSKHLMELTKELAKMPEVDAVILYGSFARGDYGVKSDVDILTIAEEKVSREFLTGLARSYEKKLGRTIALDIITPAEFAEASQLVYNAMAEGKILYKNPAKDLQLSATLLETWKPMVCYSLSHASAKLSRVLRGYKSRKGKYYYRYKGLVETRGGKILAKGVFIVPTVEEKFFDELLKSNKAKYRKQMILYAFSG